MSLFLNQIRFEHERNPAHDLVQIHHELNCDLVDWVQRYQIHFVQVRYLELELGQIHHEPNCDLVDWVLEHQIRYEHESFDSWQRAMLGIHKVGSPAVLIEID